MLITTLLANHPGAVVDIVRQTPLWVAGVLAGLVWLGLSAARTRRVHLYRLLAMPTAMGGLALWGVESAFIGTGRLPELLALWARTGKTIAFVTHSIPEAVYLSTRIVVMLGQLLAAKT